MDYQRWLSDKLEERKRRNARYSLRAFASSLGMSPSTLSEIMSGKRPLTLPTALRIADRTKCPPEDRSMLVWSSTPAEKFGIQDLPLPTYEELPDDINDRMCTWVHYAILSLADLAHNVATPQWIARQLGIDEDRAREAFECLLEVRLLAVEGDRFLPHPMPLTTSNGVSKETIRSYHRDVLSRAQLSLEKDPVDVRDFSAITFACDPAALSQARPIIERFRRELAALMECGPRKQVYTLAIQLFPVSEPPC